MLDDLTGGQTYEEMKIPRCRGAEQQQTLSTEKILYLCVTVTLVLYDTDRSENLLAKEVGSGRRQLLG